MAKGDKIEAWRREYILAHRNDRPRSAVMRAAGVSPCTLYGILHEAGAEMDYSRAHRNEAAMEAVMRMYPHMSSGEIAEATGLKTCTVGYYAKRLGLRHTAETWERITRKRRANLLREQPAELRERNGRRRRAVLGLERMRMWSGEPRRTRLQIRDIPKRVYSAKYRLMKIYGYMAVSGDPYRLVRPCASERAVDEDYYARKYGFRFTDRTVYEEADKMLNEKHDGYGNEKKD